MPASEMWKPMSSARVAMARSPVKQWKTPPRSLASSSPRMRNVSMTAVRSSTNSGPAMWQWESITKCKMQNSKFKCYVVFAFCILNSELPDSGSGRHLLVESHQDRPTIVNARGEHHPVRFDSHQL